MICPRCNQEVSKIKDKTCPNCGRSVYEHGGKLYEKNPIDIIIQAFEKILSNKLSEDKEFPVIFRIKTKSQMYRYERKKAEQYLKEAEGDLELLLDAISWLANNKKYSWRFTNSLANLVPILAVGLAVMRSWREEDARREERSKKFDEYYDRLQEDLE